MKFSEFLAESYMGKKGMSVAIRPQGQGKMKVFRLIDRESPNSMIDMSFDTSEDAAAYAKKKGMTVNNGSMD